MAFISREKPKRIRLKKDLVMYWGTFTAGHEFNIVGQGSRGFELEDDEGRKVGECGPFISYDVIEYY